jgi:RNA polymerase sigma-70 factor (ECF subfamily)
VSSARHGSGATPIDEAAVAAAYERYGHALYRRCLRLVGSEDDAHELLQEVFCQFWRGREKFEGRSSAFTYLYRIATNLSIDRLRRRTTAGPQHELDETRRENPDGTPERRTSAAAELALLTEGLDPDTLTVAVLSHVDGLTQEEIADALDLSRRTVGKRLKKFLDHTRKRARKLEGGGDG